MIRRLSAAAALAAITAAITPVAAWAAAKDYKFELAGAAVKSGKDTVVTVRLVRTTDGKPVPGAVLIQTKADMSPMSMPEMTAPLRSLGEKEPGVYLLELQPGMAGQWALTLSAKVQGETETVRGTVTVQIAK